MVDEQSKFQPGDQVVHPKFGDGVVTQISDTAWTNAEGHVTWRVTVMFASGEKSIDSSFLKLEREVHRIDRIREAVRDYGQTALETDRLLRRLGTEIISALGSYLHRDKALVQGVPPWGDWEPDTEYHDAAFSTYHRRLVTLDPVEVGVAVRIDNFQDEGATWIRLLLTLRKIGDRLLVAIGEEKPVELPLAFGGRLGPICDMIFNRLLSLYTEDVEHDRSGYFGGKGPIGFLAPND